MEEEKFEPIRVVCAELCADCELLTICKEKLKKQ